MSPDAGAARLRPASVATTCLRQERRHLAPGMALAHKLTGGGAVEAGAAGATVRLSDGRTVLDFGSYAVTLLGHHHPDVVAAVRAQLTTMATSTRVLANPATTALAARLVDLLQPSRLTRVWFGQNGTDAVEVALKLARLATGRPRVVAVDGGYHGKSLGSLAITSSARYRTGLEALLAPATHVAHDDAGAVAREVGRGDVAAVVLEPVQGEGGVRPLHPEVVRRWADDARAAGAFVVADEVQTGLWRTGAAALSLSEAYDLDPDAVLLGKPLGGGVLPLSAAVCSERLYGPLLADPFVHTATFGGHPLSCAAGLAGVDALQRLAPRARAVGVRLERHLRDLAGRHPGLVVDVRGRGLLWGVALRSSAAAGVVVTQLADLGLLTSPCLGTPEVLRLLPPAVATDTQVDDAAALLDTALRRAAAHDAAARPATEHPPAPRQPPSSSVSAPSVRAPSVPAPSVRAEEVA